MRRRERIPSRLTKKLQRLLSKYQAKSAAGQPGPVRQTQSPPGAAHQSSRNTQAPPGPASQLGNIPTTSGSATTGTGQNLAVNIQAVQARQGIVFLAVKRGDYYHILREISASSMDDDTFFAALREKYLWSRGFLQRFFGYTIYSHCNFVSVSFSSQRVGPDADTDQKTLDRSGARAGRRPRDATSRVP